MSHFDQFQYDYDEEPAMLQLVAMLVKGRGQFAVSPFPQDLKFAARTGWVVSWPKGQEIVTQTEPAPSSGPEAA